MLKNRKKPMKKAVLHIFMGLCVIFLTTSAGGRLSVRGVPNQVGN